MPALASPLPPTSTRCHCTTALFGERSKTGYPATGTEPGTSATTGVPSSRLAPPLLKLPPRCWSTAGGKNDHSSLRLRVSVVTVSVFTEAETLKAWSWPSMVAA